MQKKLCQRFERLEDRRLFAVDVDVLGGDLILSGAPEGAVEVVAVEEGAFEIYEDGELVDAVEGVVDDIRMDFDEAIDSVGTEVTLQLDGADIDRVVAQFAVGDNLLVLESGSTRGGVRYRGGEGTDTVQVGEDFEVGRSLVALMGAGDNTLELDGSVGRSLTVRGGAGEDLVNLASGSEVGRRLNLRLGAGDNTSILGGNVGGAFYYRGGEGDDLIDVLATASVEGRTKLKMGDGDNQLAIDGLLGGHMNVAAGEGDDVILVGDTGSIDGNCRIRLGEGEDLVQQDGDVSGRIRMDNPEEFQPTPAPTPEVPVAEETPMLVDLNELLNGMLLEFQATGHFVHPS